MTLCYVMKQTRDELGFLPVILFVHARTHTHTSVSRNRVTNINNNYKQISEGWRKIGSRHTVMVIQLDHDLPRSASIEVIAYRTPHLCRAWRQLCERGNLWKHSQQDTFPPPTLASRHGTRALWLRSQKPLGAWKHIRRSWRQRSRSCTGRRVSKSYAFTGSLFAPSLCWTEARKSWKRKERRGQSREGGGYSKTLHAMLLTILSTCNLTNNTECCGVCLYVDM